MSIFSSQILVKYKTFLKDIYTVNENIIKMAKPAIHKINTMNWYTIYEKVALKYNFKGMYKLTSWVVVIVPYFLYYPGY